MLTNENVFSPEGPELFQKTLKQPIHCVGVGLHTGRKVSLVLRPAEPHTGIVFKRTDILGKNTLIHAKYDQVVDTKLCTCLGAEGITVSTVEHVMAALAGCGVTNALVEVSGPEMPIIDGSAESFVFLIECAGVAVQQASLSVLRVTQTIAIHEGDAFASLSPATDSDGLKINFTIDFSDPAIGKQTASFDASSGSFKREIAAARTFGFYHEIEALQNMGLAQGGTLDNAVIVKKGKILNSSGLRFKDEFVRHKILDAVGDLSLAGMPIVGTYDAYKAGHRLTNKLLLQLFKTPSAFEIIPAGKLAAVRPAVPKLAAL